MFTWSKKKANAISIILSCILPFALIGVAKAAVVSQTPLFLGQGNVPGNLALTPSVEYPTVTSVANIDNTYDETKKSTGYFDSNKCYQYQYDATESDRHFYPVTVSADYTCPGNFWSGNYLNWAVTSTIDPFRWALTGGLRVKDTTSETWIEKARHTGQGNLFPSREISGSLVNNATPFTTSTVTTYINGKGNKMEFALPSGHGFSNSVPGTSTPIFTDTNFDTITMDQFVSGEVVVDQSGSFSYDSGGNSLKKRTNSDPSGAKIRVVTSGSVNYDNFIFTGRILRPTGGPTNGGSDRLALSDSNGNGYGFSVSGTTIKVERRTQSGSSVSTSSISSNVTMSSNRPTGDWYRFVFESASGDRFKLTVYDENDTQIGTVTSNASTSHSSFTHLFIHGGSDYYIDDLSIVETGGGGGIAYRAINSNLFETSVRVKVCDSTVGVEDNCKAYGSNWKPEGLIQRYAESVRYSVFGYLNESNYDRDGGVLRAEQKFVGPEQLLPGTGITSNPNKEWDETTGILIRNPDASLAADTASYFGISIADSGVINYINKFGQLNSNNFKGYDPVSELYYTSLRYFKNQSNIDEYYKKNPAHNSSPNTATKEQWVDGFPVVRTWNDPIQYACQKNVVLGIGDVNTHRDKNLPGNTSGYHEPTKPSEVTSDSTVDVRTATDKIAQLEGISINTAANSYSGRQNSAFMAGLAYDANTKDIRPNDYAGKQTVQTYWVDVLEGRVLQDKRDNQFWLTAKYGGFEVRKHPRCTDPTFTPSGNECGDQVLGDPYTRTTALPEWWWYTNTDVLDPSGSHADYKRADNFYTAGDANKMVDGLTAAFASIVESVRGSGTSLATSSPRLNSSSAVYSALLDTTYWSGDVIAKGISSSAVVSGTVLWSAADLLDAITEVNLPGRKIFTNTYAVKNTTTGITLNSGGVEFKWSSLAPEQQQMLRKTPASGPYVTASIGQQRLDYLRGSRALEITDVDISQPFRRRGSRLGDIVNSSPLYVDKENYGFSRLSYAPFSTTIASAYTDYRNSSVYVGKPNTILVGANDGMLHLFDASTGSGGGEELYAYVPSGVFDELYQLVYPDYNHRYYVDGPAQVLDAWLDPADVPTGATSGWKTVAATTLGAGGQGVSLIDISDPKNMDASSVLWEFRHEDMGVLLQKPQITALPNGKFGVVVTSGFSSGATDAHIWILNVADGSVIKDFSLTGTGGLGEAFIADLNRDGITDRIYVGDTNGNIWRFDLQGTLPNAWNAPINLLSGTTPVPLFVAKDASDVRQPITAPLTADYDNKGRLIILFGTGSYYLSGDNEVDSSSQVQTMYGILDQNVVVTGRTQLLQQEVLSEQTENGDLLRATTKRVLSLSDKGWYMDLQWATTRGGSGPKGEMVKEPPIIRIGSVIFQGFTPSDDPCSPGGTNNIMAVNISTGGRLDRDPFDINGDGSFNSSDRITVTYVDDDGNTVTETIVVTGAIFDSANGGISNIGEDSIVVTEDGQTKFIGTDDQSDDISVKSLQESVNEGRQGWREVR